MKNQKLYDRLSDEEELTENIPTKIDIDDLPTHITAHDLYTTARGNGYAVWLTLYNNFINQVSHEFSKSQTK